MNKIFPPRNFSSCYKINVYTMAACLCSHMESNIVFLFSSPLPSSQILLSHLFQFLLLTVVVAIISVCGYVLPSEVFLLQWFHGIQGLPLYSEQRERERERERERRRGRERGRWRRRGREQEPGHGTVV